ncbi:hypothetical protein Q1695_007289 [Nippostrongylus brasiliensis]|nr:hypothetical protein Q1695_007289 [Nippostrongylus brasiliensis]
MSGARICTKNNARSSTDDSDYEAGIASELFRSVKRESHDSWMDQHKFTLINEVMRCPMLWDTKLPSYKDRDAAALMWKRVAESVNLAHRSSFDAESARKQWKNLRDSFVKRQKAAERMSTGSPSEEVPIRWKFFIPMQFLLGTMDKVKRRTLCNVGASTSAGTPRSIEEIDMETEAEAHRSTYPQRDCNETSPSWDTVVSKICDGSESVISNRGELDDHEAFGNFIATTLRRMASNHPEYARSLRIKLLEDVLQAERNFF